MRRLMNPLVLVLLTASLAVAAGRAAAITYTIDVEFGGPGTVTPSGPVEVPAGGSQTFTFTPSGCYGVGQVTVDDVPVGIGLTEYTFTNVQSDHVLYVPFGARSTTTALDVRPAFGQCAVPETLTATVANSDGGQVQFFVGANLLATRTLESGTATYIVTSGLSTGAYTFSANYLGTSCSEASGSPSVAYDVADTGPTPVTLTLALTVMPTSDYRATTTLSIGGTVAGDGHVTFYDYSNAFATVVMASGRSSLPSLIFVPGVHVVTAVAQMNLCIATVTSEPETLIVQPVGGEPTSMTLTITPSYAAFGDSVVMTAVITPSAASGPIHFLDVTTGFVEVGTASLVNGVASLTYRPVALCGSSRMLAAHYDGDNSYLACTSNQAPLQVGPSNGQATLALAPSPRNTTPSSPVNMRATLLIDGSVANAQSGQVTYYDGATVLATVAMLGGIASGSVGFDALGVHVITAAAQFSECPATVASVPETVIVQEPPPPTKYQTTIDFGITPSIAEVGESVFLTAMVFGLYPPMDPPGHPPPLVVNGLVHFWDMTNGVEVGAAPLAYVNDHNVASFTYGPLSGSSRMLAARFYGDDVYQPSASAQVLLTISQPTATMLVRFDATPGPNGIELRWSFGDVSQVSSATLERGPEASGPWAPITPELTRDGDVTAALDRATDAGRRYFYRLDVMLVDGSAVTFGPVSSTANAVIAETAMNLLGPNPTARASQIQCTVARTGHVRLEVADATGRVVTTLFDGAQPAGRFQLAWDGTNRGKWLPAGLYFIRLTTSDRTITRKITRLP